MNIDIKQLIDLVHQTKGIIMDDAFRSNVSVKGRADFVTQVDTTVQQFLKSKLEELYPQVQFMGEEDHLHQVDANRPAWILDPIDGTLNLIYNYRHSAVSLAYYDNGQICAGIVYNPFTEETFHAVRGKGAFLNGTPIHVTNKQTLEESMVAFGTSPYNKELARENFRVIEQVFLKTLDVRRSGSAALDLSYVACGRLDGFFERNLKPWDFAAGALLVEEAGGAMSTCANAPLCYLKNQDILGTNGRIHEELQSIF